MSRLETIILIKYKSHLRDIRLSQEESEVINGWLYTVYSVPDDELKATAAGIRKMFRSKGFHVLNDALPAYEKDFTVSARSIQ